MTREHVEPTPALPLPLALDVHSVGISNEQFHCLCRDNRDLRLELTAQGELIIMPPAGTKTGRRNAQIVHRLTAWAEKDGQGLTFDSSTGFTLANGAKRSPDASWIRRERWEALTQEEQEGFAPLCPDFVLELRSPQDSLSTLQDKMLEYMANGAQLGWLIDPQAKQVYVYRQGQSTECWENPETIAGDPVLPGFALDLQEIW
jgi:Uma2 family endonuclease